MSVVSYKCPNCGGELTFDPQTQKYKCEYCFSYFTEEELEAANPETKNAGEDAGSATAEKQAADSPYAAGDRSRKTSDAAGTEGEAVLYTCPSCGAEIVTDPTTAATFCYYCHNPVVLSGRVSGEFLPDLVVPFAIDRKKAEQSFLDFVHSKKFVPNAFFEKKQIEKLSGVYFPSWLFHVKADGVYEAKGENIHTWPSGDDEYTETEEYHVEREGDLTFEELSKNALKKANKTLVEGVWPYKLAEAKPFHMGYLSGFQAERRDMEASEFQGELTDDVNKYGKKLLRESVKGYDSVTTQKCDCRIRETEEHYALLPVWTVTYKGKDGKMYYYTMNGQSGKVVGKLPLDRGKLFRLFLSVTIPVFLLGLLGGYFI